MLISPAGRLHLDPGRPSVYRVHDLRLETETQI